MSKVFFDVGASVPDVRGGESSCQLMPAVLSNERGLIENGQKLRPCAPKPRPPLRCANSSRGSASAFATPATFWASRTSASSNWRRTSDCGFVHSAMSEAFRLPPRIPDEHLEGPSAMRPRLQHQFRTEAEILSPTAPPFGTVRNHFAV